MAIRFSKRIKIAPGVRLNVGKTGVSGSIGPRGASINVGKKGVYSNMSIPGTGLSSRQRIGQGREKNEARQEGARSEKTSKVGIYVTAVLLIVVVTALLV